MMSLEDMRFKVNAHWIYAMNLYEFILSVAIGNHQLRGRKNRCNLNGQFIFRFIPLSSSISIATHTIERGGLIRHWYALQWTHVEEIYSIVSRLQILPKPSLLL